jgi:hypothetical protein
VVKNRFDITFLYEWGVASYANTGGCSYYTGINTSGTKSKSTGNVNSRTSILIGNQYHLVRKREDPNFGVGSRKIMVFGISAAGINTRNKNTPGMLIVYQLSIFFKASDNIFVRYWSYNCVCAPLSAVYNLLKIGNTMTFKFIG